MQLLDRDFTGLFDPSNHGLAGRGRRERALMALADAPSVFQLFTRLPRATVFRATDNESVVRFLIGVDGDFTCPVPSQATHRGLGPQGQFVGWFMRTSAPKGWKMVDFEEVPDPEGNVNVADFFAGKDCLVSNGQVTLRCRITIDGGIWSAVESHGAGIGISQIRGILSQSPILVSMKSKIRGVRCIKPEPYGWIFSTSVSLRLCDPSTSVYAYPTALHFTSIERGH